VSGAFSERFFGSSGRAAGSLKGVPSGDVIRLDGEACLRSLGLFGVGAGLVPVEDEGLRAGAGLSPRSFLGFPGGVVAGLEAGLTEGAAAVGIGEAFSRRLSFPLSGPGLADMAGATGAVPGLVAAAGGALPAGAAFAFGVKLGVETALGSSFFIFSFSSA
jgi:hypothetical protein